MFQILSPAHMYIDEAVTFVDQVCMASVNRSQWGLMDAVSDAFILGEILWIANVKWSVFPLPIALGKADGIGSGKNASAICFVHLFMKLLKPSAGPG